MENNYKNLKSGDIILVTDMMNQKLVSIYNGIRKSLTGKTVVTDFCTCTIEDWPDLFFAGDGEENLGWIETVKFDGVADDKMKDHLYRRIIQEYMDTNPDWSKYFTDSTYDEIQDWFAHKCNVKFDENNGYPDFICDFTNYAWKFLCKSMGYEEEYNEEFGVEMVNKQEIIAKIKRWLQLETDWDMEYDEEGRNPNYGKIDELIKYLTE